MVNLTQTTPSLGFGVVLCFVKRSPGLLFILLVPGILFSGCTSQAKLDQMKHAQDQAAVCVQGWQTAAKVAAQNAPKFDDPKDSLLYIAITALSTQRSQSAECDDVLIALIQSDSKYRNAWLNGTFGLAKFGVGALAATDIFDNLAEAISESGDIYNNSRVAIGNDGNTGSISASGDGDVLGNTSAIDNGFAEGGLQNRGGSGGDNGAPIIGSPDQSDNSDNSTGAEAATE